MKSSRFSKNLVLSFILVAMCALQSLADTPDIQEYDLGSINGAYFFVVSAGDPNFNNPNGFPVVYVSPGRSVNWGFLMDGSDFSKAFLKSLQDAYMNNRRITFTVDRNINNGYGAKYVPGLASTRTGKIIGITLSSDPAL